MESLPAQPVVLEKTPRVKPLPLQVGLPAHQVRIDRSEANANTRERIHAFEHVSCSPKGRYVAGLVYFPNGSELRVIERRHHNIVFSTKCNDLCRIGDFANMAWSKDESALFYVRDPSDSMRRPSGEQMILMMVDLCERPVLHHMGHLDDSPRCLWPAPSGKRLMVAYIGDIPWTLVTQKIGLQGGIGFDVRPVPELADCDYAAWHPAGTSALCISSLGARSYADSLMHAKTHGVYRGVIADFTATLPSYTGFGFAMQGFPAAAALSADYKRWAILPAHTLHMRRDDVLPGFSARRLLPPPVVIDPDTKSLYVAPKQRPALQNLCALGYTRVEQWSKQAQFTSDLRHCLVPSANRVMATLSGDTKVADSKLWSHPALSDTHVAWHSNDGIDIADLHSGLRFHVTKPKQKDEWFACPYDDIVSVGDDFIAHVSRAGESRIDVIMGTQLTTLNPQDTPHACQSSAHENETTCRDAVP